MKASMVSDEQELVSRAQHGDTVAFQEIIDRYKKQVYYLSLDLTGNHHDAEDLSQEVLVKAYTSLHKFRGESKISSWLHRIAVNAYLDERRKKSLTLLKQSDELNETLTVHSSEGSLDSNPEKKMERAKMQEHIDEALLTLTERERTIFVLRHYQEHALKEIAEMLDLSEGTIKSFLFRAIKKMQKALSQYEYQFEGRSSNE
jgi:RNA polymerase sigma-70 factor (ECF subfamily)